MALLAAYKLQKSFGGRTLFEDVSFEVAEKDHIGLVGANGTGKTTLLRMLTGVEQADSGAVHRGKLVQAATLEQTPALKENQTLYDFTLDAFEPLLRAEEELKDIGAQLLRPDAPHEQLVKKQHQIQERYEQGGGLTFRSRVRSTLIGLGFTQAELELSALSLSGGQLNKAMLARVLLLGADLLFLDEPTNHLDIEATEWLEAYLKSYTGAFILISHDRYFLDQVTNRTMELRNMRLHITPGNYSTHVERTLNANEIARRHYLNTQKEIRRIYGIVEQQRQWNKERNIRTAESKLKQIERLKATLVEPEKEAASIRFTFTAKEPSGNEVLIAEQLEKAYGEKKLFSDASMLIRRGERVFLLGPNGCGKTTLLRILMGREVPDAGRNAFGAGVKPAYYEQNMRSLSEEKAVLQEVWDAYPRMRQTEIRNALAAFLFRNEDVEKRIGMLSGGERARVQLLKLMLSGANLLLLDEPTNHLDIASREALEQALEDYDGALLVVTHDRFLVNRLADRVLYMEPSGLVETIGGYDAYLAERSGEGKISQQQEEEKPLNEYRAKKERQSAIVRAKSEVNRAEREVAAKENEQAELEQQLLDPSIVSDYEKAAALSNRLAACRAELEECIALWEQAEETLQSLNALV